MPREKLFAFWHSSVLEFAKRRDRAEVPTCPGHQQFSEAVDMELIPYSGVFKFETR
jgi:hypothetical protein